MTPEELKAYVEAQGFTHVSVQAFKNSFTVNYWSENYKCRRNLKFSLSTVPSKPDGSSKGLWLQTAFINDDMYPLISTVNSKAKAKE